MSINEAVRRLASRKGATEADIQSDVRFVLLNGGLELDDDDLVVLEAPVGGGRRIDVELGTTVIEVKKKLDGSGNARWIEQLGGYVASRIEQTGQRYVGILTDGVAWELYRLDRAGEAVRASVLVLQDDDRDALRLSVWLEGVMATAQDITPTALEVERRLGSESSSFALDLADLRELYAAHGSRPEVAMKRELWARLLASALGTHFEDSDELFVLHTYLVVSAELLAHVVVGFDVVGKPALRLLSGSEFRSAGLGGVVEPDFFDWPAEVDGGDRVVAQMARRLARFDWDAVEHDVLKSLYESVIDAETRKALGEYYTPDWLAESVVSEVVDAPDTQRVLDPACGSGTFLFWAVRKVVEAGEHAGLSNQEIIEKCVGQVFGIDLHPVAVALARVTYLLALGAKRLQAARPFFSVPVYLGDSLRWEQGDTLIEGGGITIYTTDRAELFERELRFPERVVADVGRFDQLVAELADKASSRTQGSAHPPIGPVLSRYAIDVDDQKAVSDTFETFCQLHDEGRDHIWGYYVRNLARPLWFSQPANRVDVLVGNPPWLSYRFMSDAMQQRFKRLSQERDLWVGGNVSTQQDLSDLFVARSIEQYLAQGGRFGFVLPAAALSRRQYSGFRSGRFEAPTAHTTIAYTTPWDLRRVRPQPFPVPAAVGFGGRAAAPVSLPTSALSRVGRIAGRRWKEVAEGLEEEVIAVTQINDDAPVSPYSERFRNGATIWPRLLASVEELPAGPVGIPAGRRRVQSLRSAQEKEPWKSLKSLEGVIEAEFVRPMYVGTDVAPFMVVTPGEAVIPWDGKQLLDESSERLDAHPGLAEWWRAAASLWEANKGKKSELSLLEQIDYYGKLSSQFPIPSASERIVYTKSGNRVCAARVADGEAVIDHTLYWAAASSIEEASYLEGILNSDAMHARVEPLMSEGLFGKRHVDKYVFLVDFPFFDDAVGLHAELAELGKRAEACVADWTEKMGLGYQARRTGARKRLAAVGLWAEIEKRVDMLLPEIA